MKINTGRPAHDLNAVGSAANAIEGQGFSGVSTQENRQDAFLPLAVAATHTTNLELRTSIAIAFARSPMVAANVLGYSARPGLLRRRVCANTFRPCAPFGIVGPMTPR